MTNPTPTIAIVAAGAMGAGIAQRLAANGAHILTMLDGRSPASRARAQAAGMHDTDTAGLATADLILSVVPPGQAMNLALQCAPALAAAARKPIFVDCNALDVQTVQSIAAIVTPTGTPFVDGGIIGLPPAPNEPGPILYLAGPDAPGVVAALAPLQLRVGALDGPVGAASALKMSYAGITKGITAIAALMILGANRAGAAEALHAELAASQPQLLKRFATSLPGMVPKAYRWVAEMREIAAFLADDPAGAAVFEGIAQLYDRIATDAETNQKEVALLQAFTRPG